ncbi:hypothetical protein [Paenibacillus urinalis]|uniref:hypothetical protein n=1 Tax=Paenibacillus urinalis TaxID=521520 RepID=UPI0019608BAD
MKNEWLEWVLAGSVVISLLMMLLSGIGMGTMYILRKIKGDLFDELMESDETDVVDKDLVKSFKRASQVDSILFWMFTLSIFGLVIIAIIFLITDPSEGTEVIDQGIVWRFLTGQWSGLTWYEWISIAFTHLGLIWLIKEIALYIIKTYKKKIKKRESAVRIMDQHELLKFEMEKTKDEYKNNRFSILTPGLFILIGQMIRDLT